MTGPETAHRQPIQPDGLLARLARLNVTAVFLVTIGYVLVALFAPGIIGGALLFLLAAGLVALMVKTWPVQTPQARVVRMTLLTMLAAMAAIKIL